MATEKRKGRPPLPERKVRPPPLAFRVTDAEREALQKRAAEQGVSVSAMIRKALDLNG